MYHWVRTYSSRVGKMQDLVNLSKEAAGYLEKSLNIKCHAYSALGGNPMTIGLHGVYGSMDELGDAENKLAEDPGWDALLKQAEPLVVEGSAQDQFWKEIT